MKYKILTTLGPATHHEWLWEKLLFAGTDGFRLNTSHITLDQLRSWLDKINVFFEDYQRTVPVVLDLQGSKWRLGEFEVFQVASGEKLSLFCSDSDSSVNQNIVLSLQAGEPSIRRIPVPHFDFFQAALFSSGEIVLNDGRVRLEIENILGDEIQAEVITGGEISSRKGITFSESTYRIERLSEKDRKILDETRDLHFIQYAISYVKDAEEMVKYRQDIGKDVNIIAKLERQPAIDQVALIADQADEIWLCRGDLGAELGDQAMAKAVYRFKDQLLQFPVPVLLAGQVLEHMTLQPTPTRSEVCYLYEAILHGFSGVVLSDETAVGKYPIESVRAAAIFRQQAD